MSTRTVVARTRRTQETAPRQFPFSRDDIPALTGEWTVPAYLKEYHEKAWQAFNALEIPTTREEAWRRTDLRGLSPSRYRLETPGKNGALPKPPRDLLRSLAGKSHGGQLVLTRHSVRTHLEEEYARQGVVFVDFASAEQHYADLLKDKIGGLVRPEEGKFAALASALARYGAFVYVPRGVAVDRPLHSILWGPGDDLAYLSHVVVWVDDGASLTYVHENASPKDYPGSSFHAGVVEIHVGEGATLRFVELQSWGETVWNFSHERARVERDGTLDWIFGAVGSRLTKNFSDLNLTGQGAVGRMSGFYFTDNNQHLDHDTQQNHLAPHTTSDLLFKGALQGSSRSVWQGMIYVAPGAQKTDGYQANRNLVLSPKARADSIPGLEILADDVRCTHGATVGKIDPDQVFYLKSRGIPPAEASRLIVEGFFDPIMQRIPFSGVRRRFQDAIIEKMR